MLDLLAYHAFPRLAEALRQRHDAVIQAWEAAVLQMLPAADALTLQRLRNSLPLLLREIADALAAQTPAAVQELAEGSKEHGEARFHDHYNVRELVIEYRLLRRVIIEQVCEALGERLDQRESVALNMAVDTAVQSGIIAFTDHQRRQIQAAAEVQSKYLSFLSHDLRNHLNHATLVLQLLGQRLRELPDCQDSVEDVDSIQESILQTTAGMDRLLQAERLRKQSAKPKMAPVDLQRLLSGVAQLLSNEARAKGLNIEVDVPQGPVVESDRELLTLALQNLLGNAVKYSSKGTVTLAARKLPDDGWVLSVSDEGPGIGPENLNRLFEAFTRGDTHGQPGVGLGLSIASQATKLLGGKLEVDSKVGVGSIFRLVLPAVTGT
jgi:signal transduction histidine kinase